MRLRLQMPKNEEIGLFQRAHRLELAARVSLQLPGSAGCSDSAPGPRCTGGRFPTLAMGFSSSGGEEEKNIWVLGLGFYLWALLTSLRDPAKEIFWMLQELFAGLGSSLRGQHPPEGSSLSPSCPCSTPRAQQSKDQKEKQRLNSWFLSLEQGTFLSVLTRNFVGCASARRNVLIVPPTAFILNFFYRSRGGKSQGLYSTEI